MAVNHINIDLPAIKNISIKGVRRAAVFLGLGINAANDPSFKHYQLAQITGLEFIEPISDDSTLTHFKNEFRIWIIGNGLRELIETFSVFLDEIHLVCLLISSNPKETTMDEIKKRTVKFRRLTFKDKLENVNTNFGAIVVHRPDHFLSINQARNCLTHRRGTVNIQDCQGEQHLTVKWIGIDVFAETASGDRTSLFPIPEEGVLLPKDGKIVFTNQERVKLFPLKSQLFFTPRELTEICYFILGQTDEVIKSVQGLAENNSIPITK
jgi:hypothetical protein